MTYAAAARRTTLDWAIRAERLRHEGRNLSRPEAAAALVGRTLRLTECEPRAFVSVTGIWHLSASVIDDLEEGTGCGEC